MEEELRRNSIERRSKAIREQAEKVAPFEDMTSKDLIEAGFKVHRLGGALLDPANPARDQANFFNTRHGTNAQGQRYAIMMGAEEREEAFMAQKFFQLSQGSISRVHFLDNTKTAETLALGGGLKCRTKPEGELISPELLANPKSAWLNQF